MGNQKIIQCLYCGNKTLMNQVGEHTHRWDEGYGYYGYFKYSMYACPICDKVSFYQQYADSAMQGINGNGEIEEIVDEEILYPINTFAPKYLPKDIKYAYESALKTKHIDTAICLIALRRTLEMICNDKGATGRNLTMKIEDLSTKGILPKELEDASKITKNFGNRGAHGANITIAQKELKELIEFIEYILEYLYILPNKIKELKEKM